MFLLLLSVFVSDSSNANGLPTKPNHHTLLSQGFTSTGIVLEIFYLKKKIHSKVRYTVHFPYSFPFATELKKKENAPACHVLCKF